ncbi:MAG: hypothetical protein KJ964_02880 [Verrucomicrobia bacterium]|nr:hypothetical protein [Verrucomicrobiota bacterium]MBU1734154.1 hypothetical protein [Verrucomicrobiota bacterium]MBU1856490.1 hypothetical protein [Verrucomicrobiota bacterium]
MLSGCTQHSCGEREEIKETDTLRLRVSVVNHLLLYTNEDAMNDSEIEKKLARFKLKDAPASARTRILAAARAAWNKAPIRSRGGLPCKALWRSMGDAVVWTWSIWRWPTYYAAAAALLLLLNGIVASLDQRWTAELIAEKAPALDERQTAFEQLCVELGRDPAVARQLRMLAMRSAPKGDINEFLRRKNQLLQATELL